MNMIKKKTQKPKYKKERDYFKNLAKQNLYFGEAHNLKLTNSSLKEYYQQHKRTGVDSTETWNLDAVFAKFMLPRMKIYREKMDCHPSDVTWRKWKFIVDEIIWALDILTDTFTWEDQFWDGANYDHKKLKKALKRRERAMLWFGKYIGNFWW